MMSARPFPPFARRLLMAVTMACFATLPAAAQQLDAPDMPVVRVDPGFAALRHMIDNDPDGALAQIEVLLGEMQKNDASDARVIFDLYSIAADLLIEGGSAAQAAQVKAQLAGFAAQFRDGVGLDPIPLYTGAAALLEDTGQPEAARDTLLALLAEQQSDGFSVEETAGTRADLRRVSALLGQPAPDLPPAAGAPALRMAEVYYATDRARSDDRLPQSFYGAGRGGLELGLARVSLPELPEPGVAALPSGGHAVLRSVAPLDPRAFRDRLRGDLATGAASDLFVYIHGYNTPFEQAARQAASIARDMRFDGVPILYSWPSAGSAVDYIGDTAAVRLSGRRLAHLLEDLVRQSGARSIHLIAEGMGNRALTDALELIAAGRPARVPLFGQVVFVTPDVDAGLFAEMLPAMRPLARRLTLYASDRARGLRVARQLYGNALRAGEGGGVTLTDPALNSIDVSALGGDLLAPGDDYSAETPAGSQGGTVLADMAMLLWQDAAPARRCGLSPTPGGEGGGTLWVYDGVMAEAGDICADPALPTVLAELRRAQVTDAAGAQAVLRRLISDPARLQRLEPVVLKLMGE